MLLRQVCEPAQRRAGLTLARPAPVGSPHIPQSSPKGGAFPLPPPSAPAQPFSGIVSPEVSVVPSIDYQSRFQGLLLGARWGVAVVWGFLGSGLSLCYARQGQA